MVDGFPQLPNHRPKHTLKREALWVGQSRLGQNPIKGQLKRHVNSNMQKSRIFTLSLTSTHPKNDRISCPNSSLTPAVFVSSYVLARVEPESAEKLEAKRYRHTVRGNSVEKKKSNSKGRAGAHAHRAGPRGQYEMGFGWLCSTALFNKQHSRTVRTNSGNAPFTTPPKSHSGETRRTFFFDSNWKTTRTCAMYHVHTVKAVSSRTSKLELSQPSPRAAHSA